MNADTLSMSFHAYAETYPLLEGEEYEAFKADVARGVREPVKYRLVNGQKEGLDGRSRLRACADLGVPCPEEQADVPDGEVEAYIDSLNLHRRHLTREQRQERVLRLRARGQSIRDIAEAVGASPATVHKDLRDAEASAGVQNRTPAEDQPSAKSVTGRVGKTYPASAAKPPALCPTCQRKAPGVGIPGCRMCAAVRATKPRPRPSKMSGRQPGEEGDDVFSWQRFNTHLGDLLWQIKVLARAYAAEQSPACEALRARFLEAKEAVSAWKKALESGKT